MRETFTVRKQSFGVGVERTFPVHSPKIEKIEVQAIGDVNRAKLYYLRGKVGKKARVREIQQSAAVAAARAEDDVEAVAPSPEEEQPRSRAADAEPSRQTEASPVAEEALGTERRQKSRLQSSRRRQKLLRFDRKLGARFVAGADEAGRGSLAGPLVVAGVLLDYACLRDHRVRPLAQLNDSKQVAPEEREELFRAVLACAERVSVQVIPPAEIDRNGLHSSNLAGLRARLHALAPPAEACLVDGFRLGPTRARAPGGGRRRHEERRDRGGVDRRQGHPRPDDAPDGRALSPATASRPTSATSRRATRRSSASAARATIHRRSFQALCYG